MPYRDQPADFVAGPPRSPSPDYTGEGEVVRVYVPQDGTVGWLIRQGDALAWYSAISTDHLGYPLRRHVERELHDGILDAVPAAVLWDRLLPTVLHTPPLTRPLPSVLEEIREAWGTSRAPGVPPGP